MYMRLCPEMAAAMVEAGTSSYTTGNISQEQMARSGLQPKSMDFATVEEIKLDLGQSPAERILGPGIFPGMKRRLD